MTHPRAFYLPGASVLDRYPAVTRELLAGLDRYFRGGIAPGSFLIAVLNNDLSAAILSAKAKPFVHDVVAPGHPKMSAKKRRAVLANLAKARLARARKAQGGPAAGAAPKTGPKAAAPVAPPRRRRNRRVRSGR